MPSGTAPDQQGPDERRPGTSEQSARRAALSRHARTAWTGALALAVTGGVLVTASASVPQSGSTTARTATSDAQPSAQLVRSPDRATPTAPDGTTVGQVLAVLDRAERSLQDGSASPAVAQAAAELGMLYTTYQTQQLAFADTATTTALRVETASGQVTFGEVAVAAMRLANLLDPSSPAATEPVRALAGSGPALRGSLVDTVAAHSGSTAGYANGRIPADVLCPLDFAPGHLLRCDAAERLSALSDRFEAEFGYPIPMTDSYRSYAMQEAVKGTKPHLAAIPGTSNHGWGLAVDLGEPIAGGGSPEYVWLRLHAPDYGWDNPSWAQPDGAKPEPWHFEFFAAGSIPNRAIDPADVGTWSPRAQPSAGDATRVKDTQAAGRTPAQGSPAPRGSDSSSGESGADSPGTAAPADPPPAPTGPAPEKPAADQPAPEKPAAETPKAPQPSEPDDRSDSGDDPVRRAVDDTVRAVDDTLVGTIDTVDGVVNGVVGGLLGGTGTRTGSADAD